jgi:protein TonB
MNEYFERLGLTPSADARSIRQAYARELKLIKGDAGVEAFQSLREAYEGALRRQTEVAAVVQPAEPEKDHAPVPEAMQPAEADIAGLVSRLQDFMATQSIDEARMGGFLRELLPESLAASEAFEVSIAELLVQGWRRGHEHLFAAACGVFGWDDRRLPEYLEGFGLLASAIQDLKYLRSQPKDESEIHLRIMHALRQAEIPPLADLGQSIVLAGQVVNTYPDLLALASAPYRLQAWRDSMSAALERARKAARARPAERRRLGMGEKAVVLMFVTLGILLPVAKWIGDSLVPGTAASTVLYLDSQHSKSIARYIGPVNFKEAVVYEVVLFREGGIAEMKLVSKDSASDDERKVANAIHWAAPYPPDFPRTFRVRYPS